MIIDTEATVELKNIDEEAFANTEALVQNEERILDVLQEIIIIHTEETI